ncbi:tripartite tricarboxylate transporter substrate binding protein [Alcaligenaceae bacterium]|nr:tripartite tricarboxylate transporter substrate binding protein [Alcaligenaceae bacterium]
MKLKLFLAACMFFISLPFAASANSYPDRAVTLIVPYPPGGGTDNVARLLAMKLSDHWSQPVIVENIPGADGVIGTQKLLRSAPDGYTILMQLNQMLLWKAIMPELKFDVEKDLALVSMIARSPTTVTVSGQSPYKSISDLVAHCSKSDCGIGAATRLTELISKNLIHTANLTRTVNVNYKGTAPMTNDLLGNHITVGLPSASSALAKHHAGTLRILAVTSKQRFNGLPDVPTLTELGYPVTGDAWYGLMVPKATPPAVINAIMDGVKTVSTDKQLLTAIEHGGAEAIFSTPQEFEAYVQEESSELDRLSAKFMAAKQ